MKSKRLLLLLLMAVFAPWAAMAQETLPVHDNNLSTNRGVPIYAYYFDNYTKAQHVFPASDLAEMEGGTITSIKYFYSTSYSASSPTAFSTATESYVSINVYLKEVESATISSLTDFSSDTPAFSGKFIFETDGTVELVLSNPYTYGGGNLLIGVENPVKGGTNDYHNVYFFVETGLTSGASTYNYNSTSLNNVSYSSSNTAASLPKTVFTYTPGGSSTATPPGVTTSDAVANLTNTSVTLGGTITDMGGASGVYAGVCYSTTATPTTSGGHAHIRYTAAGPFTQNITGLLPGTTYYYRAYAYNSANSLTDPTYGDIYSFTTAGTITLNQPANGEISASVAGGTATTSNTYALEGQSVTLTATAADGYSLDCWNVTGVTGEANGNTYTFTMPANNVTATASIIPTSGGSSSDFYYALASTVESGEKYLIVRGNSSTISGSTTFYAMERNTSSSNGYLDYGTPTFKDSEKQKITGITPRTSGHALSEFVWTITASGSDYTISAENGGSTYYLIETSASDANLYSYTTSNSGYDENKTKWTVYESSNDGFLIHNSYWYSQYSTPGGRYYYLYYSGGFKNYWSSSKPENITSSEYRMYLYKETSVTTYAITATANPSEGGTVTGSDYYANGTSCTLTATPAFGYEFVSWTEGGVVVSTNEEYEFTVSSARTLVANFESQGSCIKPTDVEQVANTEAAHQAQISWTENNEATQWQVVYSTDSNFDPDAATPITVNENPTTTITGLSQETTYFAHVRAICGANSQSGWSNQGTFSTISGRLAPTVSYDATTITENEATVTWTGVATNVLHQSYDLYYSTDPVMPQTPVQSSFIGGLTGNSHPLTGLTCNTQYYVWVRDFCGDDGYSDWSSPTSFHTACGVTSTFPVYYDFETSEGFPNNVANPTTNQLGPCWRNEATVQNGSNPTRVWGTSITNKHHGSQALVLPDKGSSSSTEANCAKTMLVFPAMDFTSANGYTVSFWIYRNGSTGKPEGFKVYASDTDTIGPNAVYLGHYSRKYDLEYPVQESAEGWYQYETDPIMMTGTVYLIFEGQSYYGSATYVDEVTIDAVPACPKPTDLTVGTPGNHYVQLSWTMGSDETAWDICLNGDEDHLTNIDTDTQGVAVSGSTVTYTLTGLDPVTTYTVKVRANCGAEDGVSVWSDEKPFTTDVACPAPTLQPVSGITNNSATISWEGVEAESFSLRYRSATVIGFNYGFEDAEPWTYTDFSPCTIYDGDGKATYTFDGSTFTNNGYTGSLIAFQGDWSSNYPAHSGNAFGAFFNPGDASTENDWFILPEIEIESGYVFSFWARELTDQYNGEAGGEEMKVGVYGSSDGTFSSYLAGSATESVVVSTTTWTQYSYDLSAYVGQTIKLAINCVSTDVFALFIDDIFVGDPNAVGPDWNGPISGVTSPYPLTGLDAETVYEVEVQAVCGGIDGESDWTTSITFTTLSNCAAPTELNAAVTASSATLSWSGAQESYNVKYAKLVPGEAVDNTEDFEGQTAAGYSVTGELPAGWKSFTTGSYVPHVSNASNYSYISSETGNYLLMTGNTSGGGVYAIMPQYDNLTAVSFNYAFESTSSCGSLEVGYVTDNTGYSTFTSLQEIEPENIWHSYTLTSTDIATINNNKGYIAFKYNSITTTYYSVVLDDVAVTYQALTPGAWNTDNTNVTSPLPISGLEMNTTYQWQVQGINASCDGGLTAWSDMGSFTTPYPTFTLDIQPYERSGWHLIASPLNEAVDPVSVGMITDDLGSNVNSSTATYDLYRFNEATNMEWENYRAHATGFNLEPGRGYLYASQAGVTLTFIGMPYSGDGSVTLQKTEGARFAGWNLVGNPFNENAYIEDDRSFYTMNAAGTDFELVTSGSIESMEGIFVIADEDDEVITFTTTPPAKSANLALNLSQGRSVIDRAAVRFGEGRTLPKLQLNPNYTKVYFSMDNEEYAVVCSEGVGEMPVSFKAAENGTYSLSFTAEEVTFNYLHLIDNMTGNDIDLLQTPSYTFNATVTDYESRFKLVFATGNNGNDDSFAFYSNGNWIISNEGQATLQVIDVNGRVLSSETVSGSVSKAIHAAPGVYMIRLINGDNVKVQKVVVR